MINKKEKVEALEAAAVEAAQVADAAADAEVGPGGGGPRCLGDTMTPISPLERARPRDAHPRGRTVDDGPSESNGQAREMLLRDAFLFPVWG